MLLDSNQCGCEEMAAQGQPDSLWLRVRPSALSPGVGHNWTRMCAQRILLLLHHLATCPRCSWCCHLGLFLGDLSNLRRKKKRKKRKEKTLAFRGTLWTQCQPETAADVEQQCQGPTVPSCPSPSTTEKTVKRPRVGGQPARTKELPAGKTTCALSNSSQNNPFPRVSG